MGTKMKFSVAVSHLTLLLLLFIGIVSSNHDHHDPMLCDGDSSEECNHDDMTTTRPVLRADPASLTVRFFLHKNINNPSESIELIFDDLKSIQEADPEPMSSNATWKILIPTFPSNGKSPFPNNVRDAYMKRKRNATAEPLNIVTVDWNRDSMCKLDTKIENSTLTYTGVVGIKVAEMLLFLNKNGFLGLTTDTHIVAFSIGAHIAGEAARYIFRQFSKQKLIYRISALDSSGPNFWGRGNSVSPIDRIPRVRRSFVAFLDVYHTSSGKYGTGMRSGDIDFYLNDKDQIQPGCDIRTCGRRSSWSWSLSRGMCTKIDDFNNLCSHLYSTEMFAKSINDDSQKGCTGCDSFKSFSNGKCKCEDHPIFGEFVDRDLYYGYPKASGVAFIKTGDLNDFGGKFYKQLEEAQEPKNGHKRWRQLC